MLKRFKNIKIRPLLIHLIVTLIYPIVRVILAEDKKLLIFTDSLTITGLVMIIGGVIYALFLHGDFDISGFLMRRGLTKDSEAKPTYFAYLYEVYEKREEAFNYPLFIGIVYILVSFISAQFFL